MLGWEICDVTDNFPKTIKIKNREDNLLGSCELSELECNFTITIQPIYQISCTEKRHTKVQIVQKFY